MSVARGFEPAVGLEVDPPVPPANFPEDAPEGLALPPAAEEDDPGAGALGFDEVDPDGAAVPVFPVPPPNAPPGLAPEEGAAGLEGPAEGRALPPEEGLEDPPADGRAPPDRALPLEPPRRCASAAAGEQTTTMMITRQGNHRESGMLHSSREEQRRTGRVVGPKGDRYGDGTPGYTSSHSMQITAEVGVNPQDLTAKFRPGDEGSRDD